MKVEVQPSSVIITSVIRDDDQAKQDVVVSSSVVDPSELGQITRPRCERLAVFQLSAMTGIHPPLFASLLLLISLYTWHTTGTSFNVVWRQEDYCDGHLVGLQKWAVSIIVHC